MTDSPISAITVALDAMEARAAKATEGPWIFRAVESYGQLGIISGDMTDHEGVVCRLSWGDLPKAERRDAAFIAASRTDLPALCRALRLAVAELEKIAKPALGGKEQHWRAQSALQAIAAELEGRP